MFSLILFYIWKTLVRFGESYQLLYVQDESLQQRIQLLLG